MQALLATHPISTRDDVLWIGAVALVVVGFHQLANADEFQLRRIGMRNDELRFEAVALVILFRHPANARIGIHLFNQNQLETKQAKHHKM